MWSCDCELGIGGLGGDLLGSVHLINHFLTLNLPFSADPIDLNLLTTKEQNYIIQHLSCDLPLSIVAGRIEAEGYWKNRL